MVANQRINVFHKMKSFVLLLMFQGIAFSIYRQVDVFVHDWDWRRYFRYEPWLAAGNGINCTKSKPSSSGPTAGIDSAGTHSATVAKLIGSSENDRLRFFLNNLQIPVTNLDGAIYNIRVVKIKKSLRD